MRARGWIALALITVATAAGAQPSSQSAIAPARYEDVVPRIGGNTRFVFSNLRYEGNNHSFRGPFDPRPESGCENAARYREAASRVRGIFVLRDALFSQQDHPVEHRACALMLPANWVTAAVADVFASVPLRGVQIPHEADDAAWAAIPTPEAMFGSFPPSERLFAVARRPSSDPQTRNAREALRVLRDEARHLIEAASQGPQEVARVGAERIAASDRAYFTESLRAERVIVLGVENPNEHEVRDENKGVAIWGREIDPRVLAMVRDAIYARRLRDGEIAIERYDLTLRTDRRRAIDVLRALVPAGSRGPRVWLWVGGPIVEGTELVRDASDRLPAFQRELARARIAHERVVIFNRPSFRLRGHTPAEFEAEVERFTALRLPLSVNTSPDALRRLLAP